MGGTGGSGDTIGMTVSVDGEQVGTAKTSATTAPHFPFVSNPMVVTDLAAGTHTLSLAALGNTTFDDDDVISVTVLELPADADVVQPMPERDFKLASQLTR